MRHFTLILTIFTCCILPTIALAQYTPIVGVPLGAGGGRAQDLEGYVNAIYALSISAAALLAVIKITIAGVKWMTTDIVTTKGDAKKDIQGALMGLLLILAAVLIINIINPNIADIEFTLGSIPTPPPATSLITTGGGNTPIEDTIEEGGNVISMSGMTPEEREQICEEIDQAQCNGTTYDPHCYRGEVSGTSCLISATNFIQEGQEIRCTEESDYTGEETGFNCTEAEERCTAAGYGYEQATIIFGTVEVDGAIICTNN